MVESILSSLAICHASKCLFNDMCYCTKKFDDITPQSMFNVFDGIENMCQFYSTGTDVDK